MRTTMQRDGDAAEDLVARSLEAAGWSILSRQLRVGRAELDIFAVDPGPPANLVVVEVRWRRRRDFGLPEETVDRRKIGRLRAAASRLIELGALPDGRPIPFASLRCDLVVVEPGAADPARRAGSGNPRIRHHRAAF